jgi:hypothetical protein
LRLHDVPQQLMGRMGAGPLQLSFGDEAARDRQGLPSSGSFVAIGGWRMHRTCAAGGQEASDHRAGFPGSGYEVFAHGSHEHLRAWREALARAAELTWSSWESARIILPRSVCACTSSSAWCPSTSTDTCAQVAHNLSVMVQLPRERMDPEDREDDQPVDLEECLAFVTVDSLMELMDTWMWHSALSAMACGRTLAQPAMRLLGKWSWKLSKKLRPRGVGKAFPARSATCGGALSCTARSRR